MVVFDQITYTVLNGNEAKVGGANEAENFNAVPGNQYISEKVVIRPFIMINNIRYIVTKIGTAAFRICHALPEIFIPKSVIEIGDFAFDGCHWTQTITFERGSSLQKIGTGSFANLINAHISIALPFRVSYIGSDAFMNSVISDFIFCGSVFIKDISIFSGTTIRNKILVTKEYSKQTFGGKQIEVTNLCSILFGSNLSEQSLVNNNSLTSIAIAYIGFSIISY